MPKFVKTDQPVDRR